MTLARMTRQTTVRDLLRTQPTGLTYPQRKTLAERFGVAPTTIWRDAQHVLGRQRPAPQAGTITVPPPVLQLTRPDVLAGNRDLAVLRALGRLEFATTPMLKGLVFPDLGDHPAWARLAKLHESGYIWRQTIPFALTPQATPSKLPPRQPFVYGLTHEGRDLLQTLESESSESTYGLLHSRDKRSGPIAQTQLAHDLLVASWCASMLDGLRRSRLCTAVVCHVEYVSVRDAQGKEQQRFDALLAVTLSRVPDPAPVPMWQIPWHTGIHPAGEHVTLRFAVEVDRGTEPLKTLLAKGLAYRTFTERGTYTQTLGGTVVPVFLVPPGRRAAQIAREWQTSWPNGKGVISTFSKAAHPEFGTLWGDYMTMTDTPPKPYSLVGQVIPDLTIWKQTLRTAQEYQP